MHMSTRARKPYTIPKTVHVMFLVFFREADRAHNTFTKQCRTNIQIPFTSKIIVVFIMFEFYLDLFLKVSIFDHKMLSISNIIPLSNR